MSSAVGTRAAMFSGVFSAGRPVDVIITMSGNDFGLDVTMYIVPFIMYRFLKTVHPGACCTIVVSGILYAMSATAGTSVTGLMTFCSRPRAGAASGCCFTAA